MTLADQLKEAEKQWQQAIAQAAYHQGRVDTLRTLLAAAHEDEPVPLNGAAVVP